MLLLLLNVLLFLLYLLLTRRSSTSWACSRRWRTCRTSRWPSSSSQSRPSSVSRWSYHHTRRSWSCISRSLFWPVEDVFKNIILKQFLRTLSDLALGHGGEADEREEDDHASLHLRVSVIDHLKNIVHFLWAALFFFVYTSAKYGLWF